MQLKEMKTCCYILFAVVVAANYTNARPEKLEKSLDEEWEDFKTKYSKGYIVGSQEERYRKNNFVQRLLKIREHNMLFERGLTTYSKGINKFSDLTHEEMKQRHMGLKPKDLNHVPKIKQRKYVPDPNQVVPDDFDWRKHGAVAEVKNQGQCGSCWAFSAVASLEGQYFKKSGKLVSMSEQNLVDCSHINHGCQGGFVEDAYDYVYINDGIDSEKSYPYAEKDDKCRYNKKNNVTSVEYLGVVPKGNEEILKSAVAAIGPISVSIYAGDSFQDYHGNVFMGDDCYPSSISNHAVTIVGYGTTTEGLDYWLVKNSWGDDYGEDGYIRMVRNKNNKCGIASEAVYPIMY